MTLVLIVIPAAALVMVALGAGFVSVMFRRSQEWVLGSVERGRPGSRYRSWWVWKNIPRRPVDVRS